MLVGGATLQLIGELIEPPFAAAAARFDWMAAHTTTHAVDVIIGLLVAADPAIKVLVLTMFDDDESVFAAAGASGYLVKGAAQEQIVRAIRTVAGGDVIFGAGIAERVIAFFAASGRIGSRAGRQFPELTEREVEILELIARGLNNTEIARRLVVSDKTVRNHVSNVFTKLHVTDRAQAIVRARESGLGAEGG
jgi:DNA-binding NarL/FixJ family response regulator